jgi:hypothetical protein
LAALQAAQAQPGAEVVKQGVNKDNYESAAKVVNAADEALVKAGVDQQEADQANNKVRIALNVANARNGRAASVEQAERLSAADACRVVDLAASHAKSGAGDAVLIAKQGTENAYKAVAP